MPLPPILRHIYNHGSDEVIRRGKGIFASGGAAFMDTDPVLEQVRFRVRNDQYHTHYTVTVSRYAHPDAMRVRCQCPYNLGDICRHGAAALFQLSDMVDAGFFDRTETKYDQRHTVVRLRPVSEAGLRPFVPESAPDAAQALVDAGAVTVSSAAAGRVEAIVRTEKGESLPVLFRLNDERYFDTSCTCAEDRAPLCVHKLAAALQVLQTVGPQAFQPARAPDDQKARLLAQYGYTLDDDLTGKFAFTTENGRIFLRVLDRSLKKVAALQPALVEEPATAEAVAQPAEEKPRTLGILGERRDAWPGLWPSAIVGEDETEDDNPQAAFRNRVGRLDAATGAGSNAPAGWADALALLSKMTPEQTLRYVRKVLPFTDYFEDYRTVLTDDAPPEVREAVLDYLLPKWRRLAALGSDGTLPFFLLRGSTLQASALDAVQLSESPVPPRLRASRAGEGYRVELRWTLDGLPLAPGEATVPAPGLVLHAERMAVVESTTIALLAERIGPDGRLDIPAEDWPRFLREELLPWRALAAVDFAEALVLRAPAASPQLHVDLRERDGLLILSPRFRYAGMDVAADTPGTEAAEAVGEQVRLAPRSAEAEAAFLQDIQNLHSDLKPVPRGGFALPAAAVLAGGWMFQALDALKARGAWLHGWENLKTLRINPARPETKVLLSSGIDWFDARVELRFGEQRASIADVKRALGAGQQYVTLDDGTLGLLPDDWLRQYGLLLKVGEAKAGALRLKKFHFGVLDGLLAEVDEDAVQQELAEKRERLAQALDRDYGGTPAPDGLQADLRPYQLAGYQWLLFLKETGWGGILADDMGLGKTVQALALFQHLKEEDADARFLVVCPTTLLYNWEAEIGKFAPGLEPLIHHGPKRATGLKGLEGADVVISTYGTVRSDVKWLRDIRWTCAVLDESQAIKNPQSQSAKAAMLLQADHRLALSGTPLQNNTFDLYSQMQFLNPGLLGSREKFSAEFATPIDKFGEEDVKDGLRRLIRPFILRRTKEAVAADLPPKTETTFWCEMGAEQRRVYDSYRLAFRDSLLGLIDAQGMERAQFHILQGLTKLRQICDAASLVGEGDPAHPHSVKLDEVVRELSENVGSHKALVFSQFLGMLALIRARLDAAGIPYAYFDGSTSTAERQAAVKRFQEDPACRVFLISLKAGGVGLNLTAADYVYIVDPWWNPAVEQQAIDRTHRIGQSKAVIAYRMVCRDSIEEKMLKLQDRKRTLAADLVTADDGAILKRLTREDVAFLLS